MPKLIFGREPAMVLGVISATLSLLVTTNTGLSAAVAGGIVATISGLFAAVTAWATRPVAPAAFTGLVAVAADLLSALHFEVSTETVGAVNGLVLAALVFLTRGQVSPVPVSGRPVRSVS